MTWIDDLQPSGSEPDNSPAVTDPRCCPHEHSQPVEVRSHETGGTEVVARICTFCLERLPASWGCTACEWVEAPRRLCDVRNGPTLVLGRPCQDHA